MWMYCIVLLPVFVLFVTPVYTANDVSVRLRDGFRENEGNIQVKVNNIWRYLCANTLYWLNSREGDAVCKELGYRSAGATVTMLTDVGRDESIGYWSPNTNISCNSNDSSLFSCNNTGFTHAASCDTKKQVNSKVYCFKDVRFGVRILRDIHRGVAFVFNTDLKKYQTLCQNDFTPQTAKVFCRQMGFLNGSSDQNTLPGLNGATVMDKSYVCSGDESSLHECTQVDTTSGCNAYVIFAEVRCTGDLTLYGKVDRLTQGSGIVKVYDDKGEPKILCADGFNENTAKVVCRGLGHGDKGSVLPSSAYRYIYTSPTADKDRLKMSFNCDGTEVRLRDCANSTKLSCEKPDEVAAVICSSNATGEGVTNVARMGEVTVKYHGVWGSICTDHWNDNAARVVCGTASTHARAISRSVSGLQNPMWIFDVNCTRQEDSLKSCQLITDGNSYRCKSPEQSVAYCYNDMFKYSLIGGGTNYGYVQITKDGKTGFVKIPDRESTDDVAEAACNSLGFNGGLSHPMPVTSSKYYWNIVVDRQMYDFLRLKPADVLPSGDDQQYLSVSCFRRVKIDGSLNNPLSAGYVLEFKYNKFYGICADSFTKREGDVVCKELGFDKAVSVNEGINDDRSVLGFHDFTCPEGANSTAECTSRFTGNRDGCSMGKASVGCASGRKTQVSILDSIANQRS
ncbi:scavenger receptor cysteine-rich type 1 protein M130 isoform X2 [Patella vulgata]|uniref:scavenger receptor cysteine-rich type 1 protein M130 isoform X2 n=1 Tax=Patella vulgata TaxID=6465 RepID=UPI0024A892A3|nr:scavenger receptor cysteine-rich type 1 protein M130 isoform X2 [Patella vulgata]